MQEEVALGPIVTSGNRLSVEVIAPREFEPYLREREMWVEYGQHVDLVGVPEGLLYIPIVGNLVTATWALGYRLRVPMLEKQYVASLKRIWTSMRAMYPAFRSTSPNIDVDSVDSVEMDSIAESERQGLLYSGGIDSTATLIRNCSSITDLFTIWGADVSIYEDELWNSMIAPLLARQPIVQGRRLHIIKSNNRVFLDSKKLGKEFREHLTDGGWWGSAQHGLGLISLTAPLTYLTEINRVLIAASYTEDFEHPWASCPTIDNDISWSNVVTKHDGYKLSRQQKINSVVKSYLTLESDARIIACWQGGRAQGRINCGACEKCLRTITGFVLAGIDPNEVGFHISESTFAHAVHRFHSLEYKFGHDEVFMWSDIKAAIPSNLEEISDLYNSRKFFAWLLQFDLVDYALQTGLKPTTSGSSFRRIGRPAVRQSRIVLDRIASLMAKANR